MTDLGHLSTMDLFDACAAHAVTPEAAAAELQRRRLLAHERRFRRVARAVAAGVIVVTGSIALTLTIYAALAALGVV